VRKVGRDRDQLAADPKLERLSGRKLHNCGHGAFDDHVVRIEYLGDRDPSPERAEVSRVCRVGVIAQELTGSAPNGHDADRIGVADVAGA
jgi:hypothetical protein